MCIRDYLQSRHVWFETLLHPPAPSASKLAQTVHVSGRFVAKGGAGQYRRGVRPGGPPGDRADRPEEAGASFSMAKSFGSRPRTRWGGSSATANEGPCRRSAGSTG